MIVGLPRGYCARSARFEDVEAVVALLNRSSMDVLGVVQHEVEQQSVEWRTPRFDMDGDTRVVIGPDGGIVGYGEVWDLDDPHVRPYCWGRVDPAHCGLGIGSALLAWEEERGRQAIEQAPEEARVVLCSSVSEKDAAGLQLIEDHGFREARRFWRMVIDMDSAPAPAPWPEGITVRAFDPETDLPATVQAVRESFRDHWGHVESPFEEELSRWRHWITEDEAFDPSLWFLAEQGEDIAGIVLCWPKSYEDPQLGWINILGVVRAWRRRGIGRALLRHAFAEFYRRGKSKVGLVVDATSLTGANRVYEMAGMKPVRVSISYEQEIRGGRDLSCRVLDDEKEEALAVSEAVD